MEINVNEMTSSVRAVDGDALLAPETMRKIVSAVLRAVEEREEHRARVRAETRVGDGAWAEHMERGR